MRGSHLASTPLEQSSVWPSREGFVSLYRCERWSAVTRWALMWSAGYVGCSGFYRRESKLCNENTEAMRCNAYDMCNSQHEYVDSEE